MKGELQTQLIRYSIVLAAPTILICINFHPRYFVFSAVFSMLPIFANNKISGLISNLLLSLFLITGDTTILYCSYGIAYSLVYAIAVRFSQGKYKNNCRGFLFRSEVLFLILGAFLFNYKSLANLVCFVLNIMCYSNILHFQTVPVDLLENNQSEFIAEAYKSLKNLFKDDEKMIKSEYEAIVELTHTSHRFDCYKMFFCWRNLFLPMIIYERIVRILVLGLGILGVPKIKGACLILMLCIILNLRILFPVVMIFCSWPSFYSFKRQTMVLSIFVQLLIYWVLYTKFYSF